MSYLKFEIKDLLEIKEKADNFIARAKKINKIQFILIEGGSFRSKSSIDFFAVIDGHTIKDRKNSITLNLLRFAFEEVIPYNNLNWIEELKTKIESEGIVVENKINNPYVINEKKILIEIKEKNIEKEIESFEKKLYENLTGNWNRKIIDIKIIIPSANITKVVLNNTNNKEVKENLKNPKLDLDYFLFLRNLREKNVELNSNKVLCEIRYKNSSENISFELEIFDINTKFKNVLESLENDLKELKTMNEIARLLAQKGWIISNSYYNDHSVSVLNEINTSIKKYLAYLSFDNQNQAFTMSNLSFYNLNLKKIERYKYHLIRVEETLKLLIKKGYGKFVKQGKKD